MELKGRRSKMCFARIIMTVYGFWPFLTAVAIGALIVPTAEAQANQWSIYEKVFPCQDTRQDWFTVAQTYPGAPSTNIWQLRRGPFATFAEAMAMADADKMGPGFGTRCCQDWAVFKNTQTGGLSVGRTTAGPQPPGLIQQGPAMCCEGAFSQAGLPVGQIRDCRNLQLSDGSTVTLTPRGFVPFGGVGPGPPGGDTSTMEGATDRPGMDYTSFYVDDGLSSTCQRACNADARCKAYTFVRAGAFNQGVKAACWLKSGVPAAVAGKDCCVSGVKGSGSTNACNGTFYADDGSGSLFTLNVVGNTVTGTYQAGPGPHSSLRGTIQGTVSGNTVSAQYNAREGQVTGSGRMTLVCGHGGTISVSYRSSDGRLSGGPNPPSPTPAPMPPTPPSPQPPGTCNADERATFSRMAGSWKDYVMDVTIGGSCENATGTFKVPEFCEGVDQKYSEGVARVNGTFAGRMQAGSLEVNYQSPPSPHNAAGTKGTSNCSLNSDGTLSCDFACRMGAGKK